MADQLLAEYSVTQNQMPTGNTAIAKKIYISLFLLNLPDNFHVLAAHNENPIPVISISAVHFFFVFSVKEVCKIIYMLIVTF